MQQGKGKWRWMCIGLVLGAHPVQLQAQLADVTDTAPRLYDAALGTYELAHPKELVGWWLLDEKRGLTAHDAVGGNAGRLAGFREPHWPVGQLGRALAFDGASHNAVVIADAPALNPARELTLSAWFFSSTAGAQGAETVLVKEANNYVQYALQIRAGGQLRFTAGNVSIVGDTTVSRDAWNHVLATFDGRELHLYLNGKSDAYAATGPGRIEPTPTPITIGARTDVRAPQVFNGLLDDVRIYSRALYASETQTQFQNGIAQSNSAFKQHLEQSRYGETYKKGGPGTNDFPPVAQLQPWWYFYAAHHGNSTGRWERKCGAGMATDGKVLTCWLNKHTAVRDSIVWQNANLSANSVTDVKYTQWTAAQKADLNAAFYHAWQWMRGGLQSFGGAVLTDPPANQLPQLDDAPAQTALTTDAAWNLYVNTVAQSLAVEIGGFVPWSVADYSALELEVLFHSKHMFEAGWTSWWVNSEGYLPFFGYMMGVESVIPAPPTANFRFLVDQNIVRDNHLSTVEHLIDWSRYHLVHIMGWDDHSVKAAEGWWGYRGNSPASRVLAGTISSPVSLEWPKLPHNWVNGCHGVVTLYQQLLRAINIPVDYKVEFGHAMPVWWTIGKSLSHGDDVELVPPALHTFPKLPKAKEYPITTTQFFDWFVGPEQDSLNVGRRSYELFIKYPDEAMLTKYCYDVANGLSHADGTVLASLQGSSLLQLFPLPTLEAMGYWNNLATEAAQFGFCGP